ncbi:MAG TPA: signal recognition particle-docking protein FtsY [Armatimonadota bacterium]|nr:signal recognition particle-docking protein FtsY [Armatimonadota bacterium]
MFKGFFDRVREAFRRSEITEDLYDDLEESLILADVSVQTSTELVEQLRQAVHTTSAKDVERAYELLQNLIADLLAGHAHPIVAPIQYPAVVLVVGVNGVGKTTTIAKLGALLKRQGKSVILAAGDTFRAAAIEQLELWGQRIGIEVISHQMGADPAAIVYDAIQAARARKTDYVIVDTAGRLHTKRNLMEELKKINRVIERELGHEADETLLVLDATTGQNALVQAREFYQAIGLTGLVLTKLDGTAKGGNVLSIAAEIPISIRYIGTGEQVGDLAEFDPKQFATQLLPTKE